MSVGDMSGSGGGDMELCGVDTVLKGAVSGGLGALDRVSGGGDTGVSGIDTVVSGAVSRCLGDLDSVSRGDAVVSVGEMSLSGGGGADVSGCDSLVSDGAGDSSGVGLFDDVVTCRDDTLLHDAVRVGDRLSVVVDTL